MDGVFLTVNAHLLLVDLILDSKYPLSFKRSLLKNKMTHMLFGSILDLV